MKVRTEGVDFLGGVSFLLMEQNGRVIGAWETWSILFQEDSEYVKCTSLVFVSFYRKRNNEAHRGSVRHTVKLGHSIRPSQGQTNELMMLNAFANILFLAKGSNYKH